MDSPSRYFYTRGPRTGVKDRDYVIKVELGITVGSRMAYASDNYLYANDTKVYANGFY